jgi:hypothetical protein
MFSVQCRCGRFVSVELSQAGSMVSCVCGKTVSVPPLSKLKKQQGLPAFSHITSPEAVPPESLLVCQMCGVEAATRPVTFRSNIGLILMRIHSIDSARMCKSCVHRHFWRLTAITTFFGWWGIKSFFLTPFVLLANIGNYARCLGMEPVSADAIPPQLTQEAIDRIRRHSDNALERLSRREDLLSVARDVATAADVTPGQVVLFLQSRVK